MKMNGGVAKDDLGAENVEAVRKGCANLGRHLENVESIRRARRWWRSTTSSGDTEAEIEAVRDYVAGKGAEAILCRHWAEGSAGIEELARRVAEIAEGGAAQFRRSTPTRCRSSRRSRPSPGGSTAPTR